MKTIVQGRAIGEGVTQTHHYQLVLAERGAVPCECARWENCYIDELPPHRTWVCFRNWSALVGCPACDGEGCVYPNGRPPRDPDCPF